MSRLTKLKQDSLFPFEKSKIFVNQYIDIESEKKEESVNQVQ